MRFGLIGQGAIAGYVRKALAGRGYHCGAVLLRPERLAANATPEGPVAVGRVADLPPDLDLMIDCAGHEALRVHGPEILRAGTDLVTVSVGALANPEVEQALNAAAGAGRATLHIATGAIGALDTLRAAQTGRLHTVRYVGRKPPMGWAGSPAEERLDLSNMTGAAKAHFEGTARAAALAYPKNANVAAAVALAGLGFDKTEVTLIADPAVTSNIHEIHAEGDFGRFDFRVAGAALPDNPRSSALAAMSVVACVEQIAERGGARL